MTPAGKKRTPRKAFAPPTAEEVAAYAREIGYAKLAEDPGRFTDYYETCGWRTNHGPMKNWQATVRNWRRMDRDRGFAAPADAWKERVEEEERRKESEARMREVVGRYAREWLVADGWQRNPAPVPLGDTGRFLRGPEDPAKEKRLIEIKTRDAFGPEGFAMLRECIRAGREERRAAP